MSEGKRGTESGKGARPRSSAQTGIPGRQKNGFGRQVLGYSILFVITALCTYALFIVLPRTFLSNAEGNIDGIAQQYPIYSEIKRMIHALLSGHGWESWSWDIGLGDDAFVEFSTRLFNPLTYLVIAFPQRYMDVGFTLMVLVSQYLSGLSFMFAGRSAGFDRRQNVMGGICYAFSGWVMQAVFRQGTFLMATMLFPLLVLGAEKIVRRESPLLFIFMVAAHVLYSMQWAYVGAITILLYFIVRVVQESRHSRNILAAGEQGLDGMAVMRDGSRRIRRTAVGTCTPFNALRTSLVFVVSGIAGVAIPGIVLLDTLAKISSSTVASTVENQALYTLAEYLGIPTGFFLTTQTTEAYTVLGMPVICVILLPVVVRSLIRREGVIQGAGSCGGPESSVPCRNEPGNRTSGKSASAIMATGLFVMSFLPVTGRIFNGFSYSAGRWYYVMIFFAVWACMELYREETFRDRRNVLVMYVWIAALAVWGLGICWLLLGLTGLTEAVAVIFGSLLGLMMIRILSRAGGCSGSKVTDSTVPAGTPDRTDGVRSNGLRLKYDILIAAMVMVSIVSSVNAELFPGLGGTIHTLCQVGRIEKDFSDSTQRVGPEVQAEDTDFYRLDQVDGYTDARIARVRANENMYWGNRSIYTYLSTMDSRWHDYCKTVGNNAGYFDRTTVYSNDNREGLDLLMGVKYFLGDSNTKKPGANRYAAYGYELYDTIDGVEVLKNRYCIGLGAAFDKYITESELMEYTPLEREQVMLQAAVVADEDTYRMQQAQSGAAEHEDSDSDTALNIRHAEKKDIMTAVDAVPVTLRKFKRIEADTLISYEENIANDGSAHSDSEANGDTQSADSDSSSVNGNSQKSLKAGGKTLSGEDPGCLTVYTDGGKDGVFTIDLPEIHNARIVLAFEGLVREQSDMDRDLALRGRTFDGNALARLVRELSYSDNEKFRIEATVSGENTAEQAEDSAADPIEDTAAEHPEDAAADAADKSAEDKSYDRDGDLVKAARMRKGKNQGYRDVEDFYINLGYYEAAPESVKVRIDRAGIYRYDAIRAYAVPMDIYEDAAASLEETSIKTTTFSGSQVYGRFTAEKDSVLYCSILDQPGWTAYIDGKKTERLSRTDICFMGIPVSAGDHELLLTYHTPYKLPGILLTIAGLLAAVLLQCSSKRHHGEQLQDN